MDFLTHVVTATSPKKRKAIDSLEADACVSSPVKLARTSEIADVKTNAHREDFAVQDFVEFPTVEVKPAKSC